MRAVLLGLGSLSLFLGLATTTRAADEAHRPPNLVVILADDLGFSDLGCYGGEIRTPNLDGLASNGLRFTQFYNTARCWPTRAALLTGYYAQQVRRDTVPGVPSGGKGVRPGWARLLPEMLRPAGYRTYHSGKWHVDGMPLENGFDRSYWLEDTGRFFSPKVHYEDDVKLPSVEPGSGWYTTTAIADHAIDYLKQHDSAHRESPFFLYLAFTSPHFPLQAEPEDIARYADAYKVGWEAVRAARWDRIQDKKIVAGTLSEVEREVGPPYDFPDDIKTLGPGEVNRPLPWGDLDDVQRAFQATKMAIHAAMVDRMDQEVGRVLAQLRAMGQFDDTLIVFLSDNGASAEIMVRDDGHDRSAPPGSAATHLCLGPGWSNTANTPFRRHKTWVHEGGISTPLVVHWPRGISSKGELRRDPGHVIDVVPTLLELAGARRPEVRDGQPVPRPPGISLVPAFARDDSVHHETLWWEHEGNRALRAGDWKVVAAKDEPWALFDLAADRTETRDLAADQPDRVRDLGRRWEGLRDQFHALAKRDPKAAASNPNDETAPIKALILPGETFRVDGKPAFLLTPPEALRRRPQPWILYGVTRPAYPDAHEKWMHEQFLSAGVVVAGIDVGEAHGSPEAREAYEALYQTLTRDRGFAARPCLLGRSRGGLYVTGWAADHPDRVAGLAGIYPVFDVRSYPGLAKAAPAFGMTPEQLDEALETLNPIERVGVLAELRVPALFIHGDIDEVVPLAENSAAFVDRYRSAGAGDAVTLIVAEGQGHNYWEGFFRCRELVDFAIARARAGAAGRDSN